MLSAPTQPLTNIKWEGERGDGGDMKTYALLQFFGFSGSPSTKVTSSYSLSFPSSSSSPSSPPFFLPVVVAVLRTHCSPEGVSVRYSPMRACSESVRYGKWTASNSSSIVGWKPDPAASVLDDDEGIRGYFSMSRGVLGVDDEALLLGGGSSFGAGCGRSGIAIVGQSWSFGGPLYRSLGVSYGRRDEVGSCGVD